MIRHGRAEDVPAIIQLLTTTLGDTSTGDASWLIQQLERATTLCLVDSDHEGVVGAIIGQVVADESEIHDVAVHPSFRRQGRAKALVYTFEAHAAERGVTRCFLEVRVGNQNAIKLYKSAAYRATGSRTGYYSDGEDAIVMSKTLGGP